jgi:hypothetical protein
VTSPARTFVDLADLLALVDLVVVGDALVRLGLCSPARLCEEAAAARTRRVRQAARRAAALVRPRVDSPMETRLRLLLVLARAAGAADPRRRPRRRRALARAALT